MSAWSASLHTTTEKKLWQSSLWEITRFTMNRLRNSQTVSDEENNNDRKFSSLVREGVCVGGGGCLCPSTPVDYLS